MSLIYLVEVMAYDPGVPGVVTLRYSSGLGYNDPSAPGFYDPRVLQPATLARSAFSSGTTTGAVETGYGALVLQNHDGALDALIDYGFDGRAITVKLGNSDSVYSAFTTLFVGTMEQPTFTLSTVEILLRDRLFEFDKPVQATKYGGTNALPAGVDGTEELKGKPIPIVYGIAQSVEPVLVNTARDIYQVNNNTISTIVVTDSGIVLTAGAVYTDLADMQANIPVAGQYRVLSSATGSYFRLGFKPAGGLRATITQGTSGANRTAAQILKALATGPGGISAGDVDAGDVTALDAAAPGPVGVWVSEERTVQDVMTEIAQSVGAWFGFDRLGKLRMKQLQAPSGSPVATLKVLDKNAVADATTADIDSIEKVTVSDEGAGVPAWRVVLKYRKRYSTQDEQSVLTTLPATTIAVLAKEWQEVVAEDAAVKTKHLKAVELSFETLFNSPTDAQNEADRRLTLYKTRRDRFKVKISLEADFTPTIDLGSVVSVVLSRFGLSGGKLFVVIGISADAARQTLDLDLWG